LDGGEEVAFVDFPSLQLSPYSFLAGRERKKGASDFLAEHDWRAASTPGLP
jgi:hypothetical protein